MDDGPTWASGHTFVGTNFASLRRRRRSRISRRILRPGRRPCIWTWSKHGRVPSLIVRITALFRRSITIGQQLHSTTVNAGPSRKLEIGVRFLISSPTTSPFRRNPVTAILFPTNQRDMLLILPPLRVLWTFCSGHLLHLPSIFKLKGQVFHDFTYYTLPDCGQKLIIIQNINHSLLNVCSFC